MTWLQDSVGSELREKVSLRPDVLQDELLQDPVESELQEKVSLRPDELHDELLQEFRRKCVTGKRCLYGNRMMCYRKIFPKE